MTDDKDRRLLGTLVSAVLGPHLLQGARPQILGGSSEGAEEGLLLRLPEDGNLAT